MRASCLVKNARSNLLKLKNNYKNIKYLPITDKWNEDFKQTMDNLSQFEGFSHFKTLKYNLIEEIDEKWSKKNIYKSKIFVFDMKLIKKNWKTVNLWFSYDFYFIS